MRFEQPVRLERLPRVGDGDGSTSGGGTPPPLRDIPAREDGEDGGDGGEDLEIPFGLTKDQALLAGAGGLLFLVLLLAAI